MGKKILVVDDEPDIVKVVQLRLKASGYDVITANDGEEGLKKVKEERPDLVVLDVMMPKLDGYKVCRLLKFDSRYRAIPILMLTARSQPEDIKLAGECGADGYHTKPLEPKAFLDKIKELLERESGS